MRKELRLGILLGAVALSELAFSRPVRQEIGKRDGWTCQNCGKKFSDGWHVQAAHYNHNRFSRNYDNPNNGRILCTQCHIDDELKRGSKQSAALLRRTQSIRTWSWQKKHQK